MGKRAGLRRTPASEGRATRGLVFRWAVAWRDRGKMRERDGCVTKAASPDWLASYSCTRLERVRVLLLVATYVSLAVSATAIVAGWCESVRVHNNRMVAVSVWCTGLCTLVLLPRACRLSPGCVSCESELR